MKKVLHFLDEHMEEILVIPAFALIVIFVFLQVVFRYVLQKPLAWSEELSRFLFMWLVYVAASLTTKQNKLMKVDLMETMLRKNKKVHYVFTILADVPSLIFCLVMTYYSYILAYDATFLRHRTSPAMDISMGFVYMALPVGLVMMSFRFAQSIFLRVRASKGNAAQAENQQQEG